MIFRQLSCLHTLWLTHSVGKAGIASSGHGRRTIVAVAVHFGDISKYYAASDATELTGLLLPDLLLLASTTWAICPATARGHARFL